MLRRLKNAIQIANRFIFTSFWSLSFILLLLFLWTTPDASHFLGILYRLSIPVYYFLFLWVLTLLLSPLYLVKYLKYILLVPKILFDSFLLADYFVFKIYRFHIDMMFINMALADFKGIGLSPLIIIISLVAFLVIVLINLWWFRRAEKHSIPKIKFLMLFLVLYFALGQVAHIWANAYKQKFIQQYTPYFPYYFPTTSSHLMQKLKKNYAFLIPDPIEKPGEDFSGLQQNSSKNSLFHYPLEPLKFTDSIKQPPHILLIALESWRADFLTPEATPFLDSLSHQVYRFQRHFSSGNVTVSGIFGLLYGIHPTYLSYVQAKASDYPSLLTQTLKQKKYKIGVYTSSNLDRFSIKAMMFPGIDKKNYINYKNRRADKNDRKVVDKLVMDIQKDSTENWFKFVFLTSSHHHYFYPDKYKIFTPVPDNSEGFIFNKDVNPQPYINDYKNALRYEDDLLKEVIKALIKSGQYDQTLIFITGDHGEEFNDNKQAYWGHGSNFTKYQTNVPLIVHIPHQQNAAEIMRLTGHIDIMPTILQSYLGVSNRIKTYSSGHNLLDSLPHKGLILTSYKDKAYLIGQQVYQTGLFVKSYNVNNINKINHNYDYQSLNALRKEARYFLQRKE